MAKEISSEGITGDGKPTADRMSISQIAENLQIWKGKMDPKAWAALQTLMDRSAEIERELNTVHAFIADHEEQDHTMVPIYAAPAPERVLPKQPNKPPRSTTPILGVPISQDLLVAVGTLAINNIDTAVRNSQAAGEKLTAEGSALDLLNVVLEFARMGLTLVDCE